MSRSLVDDVTNDLPYIYQSRSYSLRLTLKDKATGDPLNVTGSTFASQLRRYNSSPDAVSFNVDTSGAATGVIVLTLTSTQTAAANLPPGPYRWDVDKIDGPGVITPLAKGELIVEGDVTR